MRRLLRLEASEPVPFVDIRRTPKRKDYFGGIRLRVSKMGKGSGCAVGQCAECGRDVKVFVSPRRNPHSSKLGRAVTLKDHDLCRRCWRLLMHQQRQAGIVMMPMAMFIGGSKLHPRLLIQKPASSSREAS